MRAWPPSPGLSHPLGAFNKSFQAIGGPHIRGRNHRRTAEGGSVCRGWHMEKIIVPSPGRPIKMGREAEKEAENDVEKESEVLTEKSNGTGESKTNPLHNLPL